MALLPSRLFTSRSFTSRASLRSFRFGAGRLSVLRQANVIARAATSPSPYSRRRTYINIPYDHRTSGGWLFERDEVVEEDSARTDKMPIVHIVLFEFKPTITHAQVEDVSPLSSIHPLPTKHSHITTDLRTHGRPRRQVPPPNLQATLREELRWRTGRQSRGTPSSRSLPTNTSSGSRPFD